MKNSLLLLGFLLLLGGCGIMNKMTDKMDETRDFVRLTSEISDDLRTGQQVSAAIEILLHAKEFNARVRAARVLFMKGTDEQISEYGGMPPVPLSLTMAPAEAFGGSRSIPNVTYVGPSAVGTNHDSELLIAPISQELYDVYNFAAHVTVRQINGESKLGALFRPENRAKLDDRRKALRRMNQVATAVFGAIRLASIRGATLDHVQDAGARQGMANLLNETNYNLQMDPRDLSDLRAVIELRLTPR